MCIYIYIYICIYIFYIYIYMYIYIYIYMKLSSRRAAGAGVVRRGNREVETACLTCDVRVGRWARSKHAGWGGGGSEQ